MFQNFISSGTATGTGNLHDGPAKPILLGHTTTSNPRFLSIARLHASLNESMTYSTMFPYFKLTTNRTKAMTSPTPQMRRNPYKTPQLPMPHTHSPQWCLWIRCKLGFYLPNISNFSDSEELYNSVSANNEDNAREDNSTTTAIAASPQPPTATIDNPTPSSAPLATMYNTEPIAASPQPPTPTADNS